MASDTVNVSLSNTIDVRWEIGALRLRVVLEFDDERGKTAAPLVMPAEAAHVANTLQQVTDCFRAAQLAERAVGHEVRGIALLPVPVESWRGPEGSEY
jgi:hypothetical protein